MAEVVVASFEMVYVQQGQAMVLPTAVRLNVGGATRADDAQELLVERLPVEQPGQRVVLVVPQKENVVRVEPEQGGYHALVDGIVGRAFQRKEPDYPFGRFHRVRDANARA